MGNEYLADQWTGGTNLLSCGPSRFGMQSWDMLHIRLGLMLQRAGLSRCKVPYS